MEREDAEAKLQLSDHHSSIESFGLEGILKDHLFQLPVHEELS